MKKGKNLLFLTMLSLVILIGTSTSVNAEGVTNTTGTVNHFDTIMSNIHSKTNAKVMNVSDQYINIKNVSTDPDVPVIKTKAYNKNEYLQEIANEKATSMSTMAAIAPIHDDNGWVKLTLEIDDAGGTNRDIYGFYQWLTGPKVCFTDVISLGHDSNSSFDFVTNYANAYLDADSWNNDGTYTPTYTSKHMTPANTSNRILDVGGIGYRFPISRMSGKDRYIEGDYPHGLIYVRSNKTSSPEGPIILTYAHQEFALTATPSIRIPSGGVLTIGLTSYFDKFNIAGKITY